MPWSRGCWVSMERLHWWCWLSLSALYKSSWWTSKRPLLVQTLLNPMAGGREWCSVVSNIAKCCSFCNRWEWWPSKNRTTGADARYAFTLGMNSFFIQDKSCPSPSIQTATCCTMHQEAHGGSMRYTGAYPCTLCTVEALPQQIHKCAQWCSFYLIHHRFHVPTWNPSWPKLVAIPQLY